MNMSQMTKKKFEALQVLADDLSYGGGSLFFVTDVLHLSVKISKVKKMLKMEMINHQMKPIRRVLVSLEVDKLKSMEYSEFCELLQQMTRSVM